MANANIKAVITADDRASSVVSKFGKSSALVFGAVAGIAQSVTTKAIDAMTESIGGAIKRVDTLNNSTRVFANMGFKADDVKKAMDGLNASILGLPTPLDQAVRGMQMIASTVPDIKKAQSIFSAMNDAIIGFGGTADMVDNAILQLSQAFSNGRIDAQTWNSMMQSGLGPTLNAIAKQMGITTGALKEGLSDGTYSVAKFQDALIELDTKGGGGLKSLQNIVKDATAGINTGMANAKTAMARGMASIIQAIGADNISKAISSVGTFFEKLLKQVAVTIPQIVAAVKLLATGDFKGGIFGLQEDSPFINALLSLREAAIAAFNFLLPSLKELWNTVQTQLLPSLLNLWDAIQPMIPAIGVALVGALWLLINVMNINIKIMSTFYNFVASVANFFLVTLPGAFTTGVTTISQTLDYLKNHFWEVVGFIIGFWLTLPIKMVGAVMMAIQGIDNYIKGLNWGAIFGAIFRAWVAGWKMMIDPVVAAFNYIKNLNWGSLLSNVGKGIGNSVIGMIEGAINGAISGMPGMKKIKLPRFAEGVQNFGGGAAIVGERGPEVVQLPRGSNVIPNNQLGGSTINVTVQAGVITGSQSDARKLGMLVANALKDIAGSKNMTVAEMLG